MCTGPRGCGTSFSWSSRPSSLQINIYVCALAGQPGRSKNRAGPRGCSHLPPQGRGPGLAGASGGARAGGDGPGGRQGARPGWRRAMVGPGRRGEGGDGGRARGVPGGPGSAAAPPGLPTLPRPAARAAPPLPNMHPPALCGWTGVILLHDIPPTLHNWHPTPPRLTTLGPMLCHRARAQFSVGTL